VRIAAERLGADDVPDLLVVSFSSNDLVGHTFGPDSQEVLDVTLRSDRLVAASLFISFVNVGAQNGVPRRVSVSRGRRRIAGRKLRITAPR
jgi:hypothetical protein